MVWRGCSLVGPVQVRLFSLLALSFDSPHRITYVTSLKAHLVFFGDVMVRNLCDTESSLFQPFCLFLKFST